MDLNLLQIMAYQVLTAYTKTVPVIQLRIETLLSQAVVYISVIRASKTSFLYIAFISLFS